MIVGILKEKNGDQRVAMLPESVQTLIGMKAEVWVESGAGDGAFASDTAYADIQASIKSRTEILANADLIIGIEGLREDDSAKNGAVLLAQLQPLFNKEKMATFASKGLSVFSLDAIPRTTRAQAMDVLSSQANLAGYKAVILAAHHYPRLFPMLMTAAGTVTPAKVLILGAGVAGLQAIATAKRLGAVVEVFDTRPAVKEEVMSLGAKFVEVEGAADASKAGGYAVEQSEEYKQKQAAKIFEHVIKSDIVITTAQIPGRKAPILVTKAMLEKMKQGSVIIDLAASTGGNCELTENAKIVDFNGIKIVGNSTLPSDTSSDASKLYGKNIINFLKLIIDKEGNLHLNFEDDLVKGCCISHNGEIVHDGVKTN